MKTLEEVGCGDRCANIEARRQERPWPRGPWDAEPDRVDFMHAGFSCLLHRGPGGHWCGYVGLPPGHRYHGKGYDDCDVQVHGGLTYAALCHSHICHVPAPGTPDALWWLGFDCAHLGDISPACDVFAPGDRFSPQSYYKDMAYTRRETERLAEQLAAR